MALRSLRSASAAETSCQMLTIASSQRTLGGPTRARYRWREASKVLPSQLLRSPSNTVMQRSSCDIATAHHTGTSTEVQAQVPQA